MSAAAQYTITSLFAFVIAVINTIAMVRDRRRARRMGLAPPDDRARWVMVNVLMMGTGGFLFQIPAVSGWFDRAIHVPNASIVPAYLCLLSCAAWMQVWIGSWPGTSRGSLRGVMFGVGAVGVVMVVLFVLGTHPTEGILTFDTTYIHDPSSAAFITIYLACFTPSWPWAAMRVHAARRRARGGGQRWLVHGLGFLELGMLCTVVYATTIALVPLSVALGLPDPTWAAPVTSVAAALSATFSCIGFSCRSWGSGWDRFLSKWMPEYDNRVQFRRLRPLHQMLVQAAPAGTRLPRGLGLGRRNPGAALAYQLVQFAEIIPLISQYVSPEDEARADEYGEALKAAMMIRAAVEARRTGLGPFDGPVELPIPGTAAGYGRMAAALAAVDLLELAPTAETPAPSRV